MSSFLFSPRKDLRETARSLYRKMRTISFVKYFHYCLQLYRMWQQGCLADCLNSTPRQSFPHCRPLFPLTRINLIFFEKEELWSSGYIAYSGFESRPKASPQCGLRGGRSHCDTAQIMK